MKIKLLFCILFISGITKVSFAQVNDAQLWQNINVEKNLTQRILVRVNEEGRVTENFTRPSFIYLDFGATYKLNKHLHITLAYVWVEKRLVTEFWSTRHQGYLDFTFRKKIHQFQINYRLMFLGQVKDYYTSQNGKLIDYYFRNKLTIKYEKNFRYVPYIASELYYWINKPDISNRYGFNRVRYFAGIFYHPNLINEFEAYYLIEQQFNTNNSPEGNSYSNLNPPHNWVVGLGYTHTF
ncbi:MAG: DUF2490 domain-containing protein [Bacteroidia bacterium]